MQNYPRYDYVMEREGLDKVCPYSITKGKADPANPHQYEVRDYSLKIKNDISDVVGNTPMVRLSNIARADGLECELCKN